MPIYEYHCAGCGHDWSDLVPSMSAPNPPCPECRAKKAEKKFSVFASTSSGDAKPSMSAGPSHGCGPGSCHCGRFN